MGVAWHDSRRGRLHCWQKKRGKKINDEGNGVSDAGRAHRCLVSRVFFGVLTFVYCLVRLRNHMDLAEELGGFRFAVAVV